MYYNVVIMEEQLTQALSQGEHTPTPKPEKAHRIEVETLSEIKDHVGESFVTESMHFSQERVMAFVRATGDINLHLDTDRVHESVFGEEARGRIFVPGLYIQALLASKAGIYSALSIQKPYELILKGIGNTKFLAPVFAGSDVVYTLTLEEVRDTKVKSREAVEVVWKIVASTLNNDTMRPCMLAKATLLYASFDKAEEV